jgi:hypothetical protein
MQTRCPVEQDELEHDTQTGKYAPFEEQMDSVFLDNVESVKEIKQFKPRKGKWHKGKDGFEVFVEAE